MTFPIRGEARESHGGVFVDEMEDEGAICRLLCHDWTRLYPFRYQHGARIRQVLARMAPADAMAEARAAFGLDDAGRAPGWLYRDFYVDAPPGEGGLDRAIGRLRRGDAGELRAALAAPGLSDAELRAVWYEVSTLSGRLAGVQGQNAGRDVMIAQMLEALCSPMGVEAHRERLLRTLHELLGGDMEQTAAAESVGLLIHHTDLTLKEPLQLMRLGPQQAGGLYRALISLQGWLRDPVRFLQLVRAGLCSPSRQRRYLSYRLLRLDGCVSSAHHPDDVLSGPVPGMQGIACP